MSKAFLILFLALTVSTVAFAQGDAVVSDEQAIQEVLDLQNSARGMNSVDRELMCLQDKAKQALHSSDAAIQMYKLLSPDLMKMFRQNKMGKQERALFYAQMMEETGGLTNMTETDDHRAIVPDTVDPNNNTALVQYNQENKDTVCPAKFGIFCGRGILQVTRCDNYISVLHYLNLEEKRTDDVYQQVVKHKPVMPANPYWKPYWYYSNGKTQVTENCSQSQIADLKIAYKKETGMELDPYNLLTKEGIKNFSVPGKAIKGSNGKTLFTNKLQIIAAMAIWKGNCGAHVEAMLSDRRRSFEKCQKLINPSETNGNGHKSRCITQCIRGSSGGWEQRHKWFELLMEKKEPVCMSDDF